MSDSKRLMTRHSTIFCDAPDELFVEDPANVPADLMAHVVAQRGLPCDGSGVPGIWCVMRYCKSANEEAFDEW